MIFLLILLIVTFTILGTVFLRKNTQSTDKLGLSLFLFNFLLLILGGLSLQLGNKQPLKITLPSFSNQFDSISITQSVKNIFSKTYEPYKNEQIYTVGVDIDEGEYVMLSQGHSETDFSVVSSDKKKLIASSSSWGNSYIELKSGMLLYIDQSKINELIPKKDVKPSSSYPKEEGTYFAGSTIEDGSYYVIKSDKAEQTNISISGYTSFYNRMTNQSSAWRDGETIAFFNIKDGEGISFYDGLLYPLSDTTHIPKASIEDSGAFLGGTTLNSGNYYVTSTSDEQGYLTKDDLYLFSDSQQVNFIPEKTSSFYSVSEEDVISYRDLKFDNVSSAPKYKQSKSNGSFLGNVSIPIGWYKLNLQKDDDDSSELKLIDLTNNNYVSFYGSSYSSYYVYIDDTRAVTLTNISLTKNEPKIDNEAIDTWINATIEPHLPLMEEISSSEEPAVISSIYVDSFTQEESINYKDDNHPLSSSTKKDLLNSISLLSKETFLESINFSENETNFVCNLPSDFTLRFIYQREKDMSSKYIPGMPLPGHPNWYYNIFQN